MTFQLALSEAHFQSQVQQLAELNGWAWMHIRPGMNERGHYRTPVSGPLGAGWPDLVLVKGSRMVFAELKAERGSVTQLQKDVMRHLSQTSAEVYVWRPSDWPMILEVLSGASESF